MTVTLDQIFVETAQTLISQADAAGLSVDEYLKRLLGVAEEAPPAQAISLDQFLADMESLSEGTENLPPLPLSYSREDIYFDHD